MPAQDLDRPRLELSVGADLDGGAAGDVVARGPVVQGRRAQTGQTGDEGAHAADEQGACDREQRQAGALAPGEQTRQDTEQCAERRPHDGPGAHPRAALGLVRFGDGGHERSLPPAPRPETLRSLRGFARVGGPLVASAAPGTGRDRRGEAPTTVRRTAIRTFLATALLAASIGVAPALAGTKGDLDAAKAELARVQAQLDRATARWHSALLRLDETQSEILDARLRIRHLEDRMASIDARLNRRAVIAFTNGPASAIDLLLSSGSFAEFTDRLEFLGSVAQSDVDLVIEKEVAQEELRRERDNLSVLADRQAEAAEALGRAQAAIDAQFERLSDRVAELTRKYNAELAAAKELAILGQTPNPNGAIQVCPVAGPNSFVDSFGWPRDGHTHQGIDLIAPLGTPVVAAHPGSVSHSSSSSGGIQAYVHGSAGYSFYAHLSGYSSASGSVDAGTVIGYVGSTGNAGSTNHLHFEWHPGGGAAVNPYQMLLAVC